MTDIDLDARLTALLAEPVPPADPRFAGHIVALARHELAIRQSRRRTFKQVGIEALALTAVLAVFALLARVDPNTAGFGDVIGLANPAFLGLTVLALWGVVVNRPGAVGR